MDISRWIRHLFSNDRQVQKAFPSSALKAIETAISRAEAAHQGEIRFAVEAGLDIGPLMQGQAARGRALEVFSNLRVWDTEQNNGVLIYLLLAEHDVEIIADRGIDNRVGQQGWESICREMEKMFRAGRFEEGVLSGIQSISVYLERYYPKTGTDENELADAPVIL